MAMLSKLRIPIVKAGVFILLLLALSPKLYAGLDGPWSNKISGSAVAIGPSALHLEDPLWHDHPNWRNLYKNTHTVDKMIFRFSKNSSSYYPGVFSVTIKLGINYQDEDYNPHYVEKELTITHDNTPGT